MFPPDCNDDRLNDVPVSAPKGQSFPRGLIIRTDEIAAQTGGVDAVCCGNSGGLTGEDRQQLLLQLQTFKPLTSPLTPPRNVSHKGRRARPAAVDRKQGNGS